ncbi:hypothetical protein [Akkermansia massiliensis]
MTPAVANLALAKGTAYDVALVIQDAAAQPIDLTGCILAASIMSAPSPVDLAVTVTDAAAGLATVHIPAQPLGMADWELWMQATPETPKERVLRGLVTVAERVDPRDEGNPSSHRLIVRISDAVTVTVDSVDLAWWAYEQTRKLLGVDYATIAAQAAATAQQADTAAHTSSVNAAAYATEAMRHKDNASFSAAAAATSERNAGTSAQAAAVSARTASDAQGAVAEDAQEVRRLLDGFDLGAGTVDAIPYGGTPSVSIVQGPAPGSHILNFWLVTGPKGDKGDPGTLTANAGDLDLGGHLTATGGTFSGAVNANGGINIPLAAGAVVDTAAVSRAYALGMAQAAMMHQTRTYWITSSCTATNGVTINHVVPGCYCEARLGVNQHTSLTMRTTGVVGGSNYSKNLGYSLPLRASGGGAGYWSKVSMIIGSGGEWTEHPDAGRDDYRFRPVAGSAPDISRLVDVTIYYDDGYKARVRELIGIGIPRQYVVRTTESAINYNSNTGLASAAYRLVISQSELSYSDKLAASVWLIIGGAANDTVIKLADIRGWDTYHTSYAPTLYLDVQAGEYGEIIQMEPPTILNGIGNNTYVLYGLEPYQKSWITTETEVPYTDEQPT